MVAFSSHNPYSHSVVPSSGEAGPEKGLHGLVANVEQTLTVPVPFFPCTCVAHEAVVANPSGQNDGIVTYQHPPLINRETGEPAQRSSGEMEFRLYVAMIPTWWIDKSTPGLELQEMMNTIIGCPLRCRVARTALMPPDCRCGTCSGRQFSNTKFRADLIATPENMAWVLCALQGRVVFGENGYWHVSNRRVYSSLAAALSRVNQMPVGKRHEVTELLPSQPLAFELMKRQRGGKRSIQLLEDALRRLNLRPYKGIVVGV